MKKIIIIGAGIGGLTIAGLLDKDKYDIVIYEKKKKEDLGYNWYDDVNANTLKKLNFDFLVDKIENDKWKIYSPDKSTVEFTPNEGDTVGVNRKRLAEKLLEYASKKATINFDSNVIFLSNNPNKTDGIYVNGKDETADLIIDCRGVNRKKIQPNEVFEAYRATYESSNVIPNAERNVHIKPLGELGVSWCNRSPEGKTDILIGGIGELSEEQKIKLLDYLKEYHQSFNKDELINGGIYYIPVRYPSTNMIKDGYVVLGDSASMTVPMIGSGIVNTIEAASILANILNNQEKDNDISVSNLWKYQVEYFKKIGATCSAIDILKRWMLNARPEEIDLLFKCGVMKPNDLANIMAGQFIDSDFVSIVKKAFALYKHPILAAKLGLTLGGALNAKSTASKIPENFNESDAIKWANQLDSNMKKR